MKHTKKLGVKREVIRRLTTGDLRLANGGITSIASANPGTGCPGSWSVCICQADSQQGACTQSCNC